MATYDLKDRLRPLVLTLRRLRKRSLTLIDTAYGRETSYSQFGEDVYLSRFFDGVEKGFYVDVGAYHPYSISNTYLFYKKGWRGLNIEPNPDHFRFFPSHRPKDINVNLAVSTHEGLVQFTCDGAFSGINDHTHIYKDRNGSAKKVNVTARPLAKILNDYLPDGQTIDFLSIDCEGHDFDVLASNDWAKYRPKVILVEDYENSPQQNIEEFLIENGYWLECKLRLTKIFVTKQTS